MVQFMQWFWREEFWLSPGIMWEDLQETEDIRYPQPHHLLFCFPIALLLVALRFIFERKIAIPLSKKLSLQEKVRREPSPNQILEAFYAKWRKGPQKEEIRGLAKQCDLQSRQVERWFRYRMNQNQPSMTKKFCEACWRAVYMLIFSFVGWAILYDKPWFWNVNECLDGYPQPAQLSLLGFYLMQFSMTWSSVLTMPFDIKQKDFHIMIVHHVVTILLVGFSYCVNHIRIGSVVMFLHDVSDWPLFATKVFIYLKWQKTRNTLFVIFALGFLFARGIVFPYKFLYNTYNYVVEFQQPYFGCYVFMILLLVLYLLNVFWCCLIILMIYRFLIHSKLKKDVRSDSEGSEEEDVDEEDQKAE
ncbi:ceramide synthase 4-like [Erythrolamprus reginae]|uniref:ceramide synthase 4-like n=1 Tax=Erythrolamprus reginae TaxID=121349 RepID=UPI00396CA1C3